MSLLFYTCYTIMVIPGDALGWELTNDYAERTRVMSWFSVTVKISLLIMPWMFALTQSEIWASEQQGLRVVGALFGLLFSLTGVIPAIVCKERNFQVASQEGKQKLRKTLMLTLKNRNCLRVYGIALMALFAGQTYMLFGTHLAVYYLFDGLKVEGAKFFGIFGTLAAPVGLVTIAIINRFFIETDKRKVLLGALGTALLGWILAIFLITPDHPWLMLIPISLNAVGVAGFWLMLGSVLADVADEDELISGHRREGSIAAFASFLCKLAGTLGAVLGGILLSRSGFNAEATQQAPEVLRSIKFIYVGFPVLGYLGALILVWRYPLSRVRMLEIRAELEQRREKTVESV
jgi:GPH family glycoside/pentoside/hexuronide:cation symporter